MTGFWDAAMMYFETDEAVRDFALFLFCYGFLLIFMAVETYHDRKG